MMQNLADPVQDPVLLKKATAPTRTGVVVDGNANDDDLWLNDVMLDA